MGVSVSRIVRAGARDSIALKLWVVHYLLNLLWAPLFFGLQYLRVGLVINFALVSTLLVILNLFRAIDPIAAYLQVPYPVVNLRDKIK
jgi:tryptophan-rich sensory protein